MTRSLPSSGGGGQFLTHLKMGGDLKDLFDTYKLLDSSMDDDCDWSHQYETDCLVESFPDLK